MATEGGKYRRLFVRIWGNPQFLNLSADGKLLALYVVAGPQGNRCGMFRFSIERAAGDLQLSTRTLRALLPKVLAAFGWRYDADNHVLWIPSWWKYNRPQNKDAFIGIQADLTEVPSNAFNEEFNRALQELGDSYRNQRPSHPRGDAATREADVKPYAHE